MREFTETDRNALYEIIAARRDIRSFRSDPVPQEVLKRVFAAAHAAPSVGFMQPWRFIWIEDLEFRRQVKASFEKANQAEKIRVAGDPRASLYSTLKLEGILDTPLNIAVACDHRGLEGFTLGRSQMPQTELFSVCCSIQNLWLAARAEGVGVGWVSILDPREIEKQLGFPDGVELVAYLCIGYPVSFEPTPLLERVGWKKRYPLEDLVISEKWGGMPVFKEGV